MKPLTFLVLTCVLTISSLPGNSESCAQTPKGPNVVLFVVDDMGWADWEKRSDFYETPNLTKLAGQGVEFTQAYASASICSPTRASLLTGLSPAQHRITKWIPGNKANEVTHADEPRSVFNLDQSFYTLGEAMKDAGYQTAHIGKWHLGQRGEKSADPTSFGFVTNIGGSHIGGPSAYTNVTGKRSYLKKVPKLDSSINERFLSDHLAIEAKNYINARVDAGEKFFLNFDLYAVHTPIQAHPDHVAKFIAKPDGEHHNNADYASMLKAMDEALGTVLETLEARGIRDDTVVIFTSDHGGLTSPAVTSNKPLRGGKGQQWEGGHRVPLIISGPGIEQELTSKFQTISHDLYPTILEMTGVSGNAEHNKLVEGTSLVGALSDTERKRAAPLFWHFPHKSNHKGGPYGAVVHENFKFIEVYDTGELLLFDLASDVGEQQNIAEEQTGLATQMRQSLHDYLRKHDAALWRGKFRLLP